MTSQSQGGNSHFTVFIRLPFPRGDFVDPPPIEWNAAKDQALWDVLCRPQKGDGIDWKTVAEDFQVTLQFLLQQAAWLYDRQLSQVRAQMRKVGATHSHSPSSLPQSISGSAALGNQPTRPLSNAAPRAPSRLASNRDIHSQQVSEPQRVSSSITASQTRDSVAPSRTETPTEDTLNREINHRRLSAGKREQPMMPSHRSIMLGREDAISSSSDESESRSDADERKPPRFKRIEKFSALRSSPEDDEADDDDSPAFLPLPREARMLHANSGQDLSATLRLGPSSLGTSRQHTNQKQARESATESPSSSASSGIRVVRPESEETRRRAHAPVRLSHHQATGAAGLSPRRSITSGKSASDDTPSMGSSFSDLDDASVTQSALEEALMSNMQHGGMASRMSTISQALRSRYL